MYDFDCVWYVVDLDVVFVLWVVGVGFVVVVVVEFGIYV